MTDDLLKYREEFPILATTTYLISHSLAPMPRGVHTALADYANTWATRGIRAWEEGWWDLPVTTGNLIAPIVGAPQGRVLMHPNVSICQSIVTSCFNWSGKRNKLITDGLNFPSNDYHYYTLESRGANVVRIPADEQTLTVPLDRILDAIDDQTQLVSISHVAFRSSALQDLKAITEKAHAHGAYIIADLYQSAGIVPLSVTDLNLDFAVGGSVKWLLGGPGAGYLYVRPGLDLAPEAIGWAAHAHPFAFAPGPIQYADDIRRYDTGTPNVPALYSARTGYQLVNQIGVEAIRAKSQRQTQLLIQLADEAGIPVRSPRNPDQRGGAIILGIPDSQGRETVAELGRRGILIDHRPGAGLRLSPHFYTKDEELHQAIQELNSILPPRASFTPRDPARPAL